MWMRRPFLFCASSCLSCLRIVRDYGVTDLAEGASPQPADFAAWDFSGLKKVSCLPCGAIDPASDVRRAPQQFVVWVGIVAHVSSDLRGSLMQKRQQPQG